MIGRRLSGSTRFFVRYWEAMYQRADLPVDSEAEPAADWGAAPAAGTTAHLLSAVGDDQGVEPACSVAAADSPLPSCVTLV